MKKIMEKLDINLKLGGIFGIVAIIAIVLEVLMGALNGPSLAGGIKDIAGTMVNVMVFFIAAKALLKKVPNNFKEVFTEQMTELENKYNPLLRLATDNGIEQRKAKLEKVYRYELSTSINALFDGDAKNYAAFFEFDIEQPKKISFNINKTTFMGRSTESFDPLKEKITLQIENGLLRRFEQAKKGFKKTASGFDIEFTESLKTKEDALMLASLVDIVVLLYIAECKK